MKFKDIYSLVGSTPCSDKEQCRLLYDWIVETKPKQCLELGVAYGKTTCVIAAALDELKQGHLTSIDLESTRDIKKPANVVEQVNKAQLTDYVSLVFSPISYTWELMKIIEQQTKDNRCEPVYDFVYLDGSHLWETDACAFFLITKLLKPGGWLLFDDYAFTIATSGYWATAEQFKHAPQDFMTISHVERIVTLLLKQSPDYDNVLFRDNWVWAQRTGGSIKQPQVIHLTKTIIWSWIKGKLRLNREMRTDS